MLEYFNPDFQAELKVLLERGDNMHLLWLIEQAEIEPIHLFQYGIQHLPSDPVQHDDKEIGTFFLVVSELKDIPDEVRDFALDTMLYCEGSGGPNMSYDERLKYYQKIKPILL